jgi:putative PIN family toxin of toxin-antitoxin system
MIIVLDTNVIISALLSPDGNGAKLINWWEDEAFEVASSAAIMNVLERALTYERVKQYINHSSEELVKFLRFFRTTAILFDPKMELDVVQEDPDDNRILECALAAQASYIATGDRHLLSLGEFADIEILPPAGFLTLLNL